jgi:hypothetical protein
MRFHCAGRIRPQGAATKAAAAIAEPVAPAATR